MKWLTALAACILTGCVVVPPGPSTQDYDQTVVAAIQEASALRAAGTISSAKGSAAHVYLRLQQRFPSMPRALHAYWTYMVDNAPLIDAGRATPEEIMVQAELRMNEVTRQDRAAATAANAEFSQRMAAGFRAAAEAYKPPQQINCQSYTSAGYTNTSCR